MTANDRDQIAADLLHAPAGLALLALVEGLDVTPADLADPLTAFHLATAAMDMIVRWDTTTLARLEPIDGGDTVASSCRRAAGVDP